MIARVYQAISAIAGELAHDGVAKTRFNAEGGYFYRGIDDVLERLAPLLARHRVCILPRVLERSACERVEADGTPLTLVTLKAAFDMISAEDGSCHTIEAYGEALDPGDKGTAKAMQSAYKYAVLQAFCIPASDAGDADARSPMLAGTATPAPSTEPPGGWRGWCDALLARVADAATQAALGDLQAAERSHLTALAREQPAMYREVGEAFARGRDAHTGERPAAPQPGGRAASGREALAATRPAAGEEAGRRPRRTATTVPPTRSASAPIVSHKPNGAHV